jgi:hypothetical protein
MDAEHPAHPSRSDQQTAVRKGRLIELIVVVAALGVFVIAGLTLRGRDPGPEPAAAAQVQH